jgi:hypothetical protein
MKVWPKRIWLLPENGAAGETTWCDDPAPGDDMDPADAIEYVRADIARLDDEMHRLRVVALLKHLYETPEADRKKRIQYLLLDEQEALIRLSEKR